MKGLPSLKEECKNILSWNQVRIDLFCPLLLALLLKQTLTFSKLAKTFGESSRLESRYRRINRFLSGFDLDETQLILWMLSCFDALCNVGNIRLTKLKSPLS